MFKIILGWGQGVGQYDLIIRSHSEEEFAPIDYELKITGDSEYMDRGEKKELLKSLFASLLDKIEIIG